jgi:hypothetical protein
MTDNKIVNFNFNFNCLIILGISPGIGKIGKGMIKTENYVEGTLLKPNSHKASKKMDEKILGLKIILRALCSHQIVTNMFACMDQVVPNRSAGFERMFVIGQPFSFLSVCIFS